MSEPRRHPIRMSDTELQAVMEAFLYAEAGCQDGDSGVFTNGGHGRRAMDRVWRRLLDEERRRGHVEKPR